MHKVYFGLGSNVGDRGAYIEEAIRLLAKEVNIEKRAEIYESKAFGVTDQDNFINTAIVGTTDLSPIELLQFIKEVEKKVGRKESFHWGPREIDMDILFYDNIIYNDEILEIPHRDLAIRDFVLLPLSDISPDLIHPSLGRSIKELLANIRDDDRTIIKQIK